jgi:hypothetical protein
VDFGVLATCLQWLGPAINTLKLRIGWEEGKKNAQGLTLGAFEVK